MKVIELLNKIANGEEVPKKIKFHNTIWEYDEPIDYKNDDGNWLFDVCMEINKDDLTDEIEIIEEDKKIEKIRVNYEIDEDSEIDSFKATTLECHIADKINEIIDYLQSKGE